MLHAEILVRLKLLLHQTRKRFTDHQCINSYDVLQASKPVEHNRDCSAHMYICNSSISALIALAREVCTAQLHRRLRRSTPPDAFQPANWFWSRSSPCAMLFGLPETLTTAGSFFELSTKRAPELHHVNPLRRTFKFHLPSDHRANARLVTFCGGVSSWPRLSQSNVPGETPREPLLSGFDALTSTPFSGPEGPLRMSKTQENCKTQIQQARKLVVQGCGLLAELSTIQLFPKGVG